MKVFVDTSAFYALEDGDDAHHGEARRIQELLRQRTDPLYTTHDVLDECVTLIGSRIHPRRAVKFARRLLSSKVISIVRSDRELEKAALKVYERFDDPALSFTDCLSFATMRALRIETVFAFDRHFEIAHFDVLRAAD